MYDVLIIARNEQSFIKKTLCSVKRQTIKPDSIIVVNDNSTDKTKDIAKELGAKVIDFPYSHPNWVIDGKLGIVFTYGMEFFNKNNDYFMILGADHVLPPNYFESCVELMKKNDLDVSSGIIENETTESPRGSGRIFTKKAMNCIGWKYPGQYGYETYVLLKIQTNNMNCGVLPIRTKIQRPTGFHYTKKKYFHMGYSYRAIGYSLFYGIGRGLIIGKKYGWYNGLMFSIGYLSNQKIRYEPEIRKYCKKNLKYSFSDIFYQPKSLFRKLKD